MSALADDAPRGFVPKADLYRALAEIDRLKETLASIKRPANADERDRIVHARMLLRNLQPYATRLALLLCEHGELSNERIRLLIGTSDNCVKVHIHKVRVAIKRAGGPDDPITTVWGVGYVMTARTRAWLRKRAPEAFAQRGITR